MLILLLGTGIFFTFSLRFIQITKFKVWVSETFLGIFKKSENKHGISPYRAAVSALASSIGTGNIVGVATAIAAGGPGTVFWMWVSAFFGMATKYAEIVLAVRFRRCKGDLHYGGPMYYIEDGLGKGYRPLAAAFCIAGAAACLGTGAITQANSISSVLSPCGISPQAVGITLAAITALSISGGIKRISSVAEKLVPIMALLYLGGGLLVAILNPRRTLASFSLILRSALLPKSVYGAAFGECTRAALRYGVARGVFSNEAGLGSSPIVHAAADSKSPEKQGYWGIFEVFVDTIILCTVTAIVIISADKYSLGETGAGLVNLSFSHFFGGFGEILVGLATILFSLTTILSWSYYGESCVSYLTGGRDRFCRAYKLLFIAAVLLGAKMKVGLVWELSDMFSGLMMIPNIIALLSLSHIVTKRAP